MRDEDVRDEDVIDTGVRDTGVRDADLRDEDMMPPEAARSMMDHAAARSVGLGVRSVAPAPSSNNDRTLLGAAPAVMDRQGGPSADARNVPLTLDMAPALIVRQRPAPRAVEPGFRRPYDRDRL